MEWTVSPLSLALLAAGVVLLVPVVVVLFVGIPAVLEYAVPLAFVAGAAIAVGVWRLEREVEAATA